MANEIFKATLERDPIVEALFEIRFSCKEDRPSGLLPGVLYPSIRDSFPKSQILDVNNLPIQIRDSDPNLRYTTTQRFIGDRSQVNVGPRALTVVSPRPYMGWKAFKPIIIECLAHLQKTDFIDTIERFSLRYINVIAAEGTPKEQFSKIRFNGNLGEFDLTAMTTQTRTEVLHKGLLCSINVSSNTNAAISQTGEQISGILLDIDTIQLNPQSDFWSNPGQYIENVHEAETDIFFGTLTPETLAYYGYKHE